MFPAERIVGVPIVESGARFASPVRYGDVVRIETTVSEVREKTFRVEHEISVGRRHCATGFEVRAWVAQPEHPGGALAARPIPARVAAASRESRLHEAEIVFERVSANWGSAGAISGPPHMKA